MIEQVKYSPDPGLLARKHRLQRRLRLQFILLVGALLFALLVGVSLLPLPSPPAKAGTLINNLEFGLSQCPSYTQQETDVSDRLLLWDSGGHPNDMYSSVFAQWIIPTVTPTADDRYAAFWPGFTDNNSEHIVQGGFATNSFNGRPQYYAWWETFPELPHILDTSAYAVLPGDTVSVRVTRFDHTDQNWLITLDDLEWSSPVTVQVAGFTDHGEPQYGYETQPGTYATPTTTPGITHQFSPHTSPINVLQTSYTVFGDSTDQYNSWSQGTCVRSNQHVVVAYTSVPDSSGGFTITTDPPTPPYPLNDYGPGDNSGCCFSFSGGDWDEDFDAGGEEGQAIKTPPSSTNQTTDSATWHPPLSANHWYNVVVYIPPHLTGPLGSAHYYIDNQYYAHRQLTLNQASYKGQWVALGTFQADGIGHLNVALQNDTSQSADYALIADAMRFAPTSAPSTPTPTPTPPPPTCGPVCTNVGAGYNTTDWYVPQQVRTQFVVPHLSGGRNSDMSMWIGFNNDPTHSGPGNAGGYAVRVGVDGQFDDAGELSYYAFWSVQQVTGVSHNTSTDVWTSTFSWLEGNSSFLQVYPGDTVGMTLWFSGSTVYFDFADITQHTGTIRNHSTTTPGFTVYSANWMVNNSFDPNLAGWSGFTMTNCQIMVNGAWQPITYNHYNKMDLTASTGKKLATFGNLSSGNTSFSVTFIASH